MLIQFAWSLLAQASSDPLIGPLVNAGGMSILAVVLYTLHKDALKTFREEQMMARESYAKEQAELRMDHSKRDAAFLDMKLRHHEHVMSRLGQLSEAQAHLQGWIREHLSAVKESKGEST